MSASFKQLYVIVDCQDDRVILHKPLKNLGYGTHLFLPNGERYDCFSTTLDKSEEASSVIILSDYARFILLDEDSPCYGMYEHSIETGPTADIPNIIFGSVISVTSDYFQDEHNVRADYFRGFYNERIRRTLDYFKVKNYQLPDPNRIDIFGFPKNNGE